MLTKLVIAVAALGLGAGSVVAQTVTPRAAKPTAPRPAPAPVVLPDAVSVEEMARHAAELAAQGLEIAVGVDDLRLRGVEEAVLAQSSAQTSQREMERALQQAREQLELARTGAGYDRGTALLDSGKYDEAIAAFDGAIKAGGSKVEGAYYWKAYAQNRLGQRSEALATLDAMLKAYPSGRWANDARALQVEVRQASGQPVNPNQATDDEIKLIALNSIVRSQPEQAVAIIEGMLAGAASPRVKGRALLVLSQASTPRAKTLLVEIAKGKGNPDLQMRAIDYFGTFSSSDADTIKQMVEIYRTVSDVDVKKRIIRSLASQGRFLVVGPGSVVWGPGGQNVVALEEAARNYAVASAGARAVVDGAEIQARIKAQADERTKAREARAAEARAALWQIYQSESSLELKKEILRTSFLAGDPTRLMEIVRAEKNAELRLAGIRSLGMNRDPKVADTLLSIYREDKDADVRRSVVEGLYLQQNAAALVQLARQETDPELRRHLVERLSHMKAKEATDYMMELLKK